MFGSVGVKLGCGGGTSAFGMVVVDVNRNVLGAALTAGDATALAGLSGSFAVGGACDKVRGCFVGVPISTGVDVVDVVVLSFLFTAALMSSLPGGCFFGGSDLLVSTLLAGSASALVSLEGARF
jgi:hypothetical protein